MSNMTPSHSELMKELYPLYEKEPERFMRFFNTVYLKLASIPEGGLFRIAEHCRKEEVAKLFSRVANLLIIEEMCRKDVNEDVLEFVDDSMTIRRRIKFVASTPFRKGVKGI